MTTVNSPKNQTTALGSLLQSLRKKKGYSLVKLQEISGVSQGYISELEVGTKGVVPKKDKLEKIMDGLEVTKSEKEQLIKMYVDLVLTADMKDLMQSTMGNIANVEDIDLVEIPLYASVSAGLGCEACHEPIGWIHTPDYGRDVIAVSVKGDSMEDTILDGATIIVKKDVMVEVGEIGVFLTTGTEYPEGLVKRLRHKNGRYILESDNPKYKDITINTNDIVSCGKVIKILNDTSKRTKDPLYSYIDKLDPTQRAMVEAMLKGLVENNK